MAIEFKTNATTFKSSGTKSCSVSFENTVVEATAVLQGFYATYGDEYQKTSTNHVEISNVSHANNSVTYDLTFDFNDTIRERTGNVKVAVIAETA